MNTDSAACKRDAVSPRLPAETIKATDCSVVIRRFEGPAARELFFLCQPAGDTTDASGQAEAIYRAIERVLVAEGGSAEHLVSETVFLRDLRADIASVRSARQRVLDVRGTSDHRPALTEVKQPPADRTAHLQVSCHAVVPRNSPLRFETIPANPACNCVECAGAQGLRIQLGEEVRFHAGGLCGSGADAYQQTLSIFALAENLLQQAGMAFRDVVRTWIHLRDIDRDYPALNQARREFFAARGIDPVPASTGIGGAPVSAAHDLCLGLYAVKGGQAASRSVMTSPTLNEAMQYGADFVRGMKTVETNRVALHVSGTASIDEHGRTVHVDDLEAQADRMLVNIAALLEGQGATFGDVVSATTYVKRQADAARLRKILQRAGFDGFPNAIVLAPICRPELLCEIEALAVLPGTPVISSR